MKTIKLVQLFILMCGSYSFAQVGIGTTSPNPSAQLEVVSNNKGILIPQLALTSTIDASTITNGNIESLLVYNTSTVSGLTPGYYYWSNAKWNRLATTDRFSSVTVDDNLTSTSTANALSAYQGLVLKGLVDVNTAKEGITTAQASEITANTVKVGITTAQAAYIAANKAALPNKVDVVTGKELSANDFTDVLKTKLDGLANTAVTDNLTSTSTTDALSANQGLVLKGLVDTNGTAIVLNTAKVTNVSTDLTITGTIDARTIESSDGTNAVIPVATTALSGVMSTTIFDAVALNTAKTSGTTTTVTDALTSTSTTEALSANQGLVLKGLVDTNSTAIALNTAKATNVSTDLTISGTTAARTIESSDGTNAVIPVATTAVSGVMSTTLFNEVAANTLKTSGTTTTVTDALTSTSTTDALSANQGEVLKGLVDTNGTSIALNTAKITNVTTDLTITGTTAARTIESSDGTNAVIPVATTAVSGVMSTTIFDAVAANTAKTITTIINDVTTGGTTDALSAEQGKTLESTKLNKTLADASVFIGNASNSAVAQSLSGDATLANDGALTIEDNAVDGTDIELSSEAAGSLMYNDGTDWLNLPAGSAGQSLVMNTGATAPQWQSGGPTEDVRVLLGSGTNLANTNTVSIAPLTWGGLEAAGYESVEFYIKSNVGPNPIRGNVISLTTNWADNSRVYFFTDGVTLVLVQNMDIAGSTAELIEYATAFDSSDIEIYGVKAQKTVINTTDIAVNTTGITDGQVLAWNTANSQLEPVDAGGGSFTSLSDTDVTGVATGAVNYFDGTNWVDLPKGTAGQFLKMNATATAPEWVTPISKRIGEFVYAKSGKIEANGYLAVTPGTITNGATTYPLWAAQYPEFVSGNDIVFPTNVAGMFLRNKGGNAASEGISQDNLFKRHQHNGNGNQTGSTNIGSFGLILRSSGSATAAGTDYSPGEPHLVSAPQYIPAEGGVETRPINRAYQLYTIVDTY